MFTEAKPPKSPLMDARETRIEWHKLQIADHARLMADNQRDLNHHHSRLKADAAMEDGKVPAASQSEDSEMIINIDSPTTIEQAPVPAVAKPSMASILAPWLLGPAVGATALAGWMFLNRPAVETAPEHPPAVERPDKFMRYDIEKWVPGIAGTDHH